MPSLPCHKNPPKGTTLTCTTLSRGAQVGDELGMQLREAAWRQGVWGADYASQALPSFGEDLAQRKPSRTRALAALEDIQSSKAFDGLQSGISVSRRLSGMLTARVSVSCTVPAKDPRLSGPDSSNTQLLDRELKSRQKKQTRVRGLRDWEFRNHRSSLAKKTAEQRFAQCENLEAGKLPEVQVGNGTTSWEGTGNLQTAHHHHCRPLYRHRLPVFRHRCGNHQAENNNNQPNKQTNKQTKRQHHHHQQNNISSSSIVITRSISSSQVPPPSATS